MTQRDDSYSVELTRAELEALYEATFAVPLQGFGPADPKNPTLTARQKVENVIVKIGGH